MRTTLSKYLLIIAVGILIILVCCVVFLPVYLRETGKNISVPIMAEPETNISPEPIVSQEQPVIPPVQSIPAEGEREYKSSRIRAFFREPVKETEEVKLPEAEKSEEIIPSAPSAPENAGY